MGSVQLFIFNFFFFIYTMCYFLKPTCVFFFNFFFHSGPAMLKTFFINSLFFNFFILFIQHVTYEVEANVFLFLF